MHPLAAFVAPTPSLSPSSSFTPSTCPSPPRRGAAAPPPRCGSRPGTRPPLRSPSRCDSSTPSSSSATPPPGDGGDGGDGDGGSDGNSADKNNNVSPADAQYRPATPADCARDFLTQRAVQQTIFCAHMLRDETTGRWLEAFAAHTGLYDLHACDALRLPSARYIRALMTAPPECITVKKPIPGRTNLKNPLIKRRYLTYDVDIVPRMIARRMLSARLQIAEELTQDLQTIRTDSHRLVEQYRRAQLARGGPDSEPAPAADVSVDLPPSSELSSGGSSPYRAATLDLAQNYTLHLALRAVATPPRALPPRPTAAQAQQYAQAARDAALVRALLQRRGADLLRPYGAARGAADALVAEMLALPPAVGADGAMFDPAALVQTVLGERVRCVAEWAAVVAEAPREHVEIERSVLEDEMK